MALVIFGDSFTFPDGGAATNRVYTYAKGFSENGEKVYIICFRNDYLDDNSGEADNIKYFHPFGQQKRNNIFIIRKWFKFLKYFKTYILLKKLDKQGHIEALIVYSENLFTQFFAFLLAKLYSAKIIVERSEHPFRNIHKDVFGLIIKKLKLSFEKGIYDGMFCISNFLSDFYEGKGFLRQKILMVPSTVDAERFSINYDQPLLFNYIAYCGSLTIRKDGVDILLESFSLIAAKYPDLYLVLIGAADSQKDEAFFRDLSKKLKIDPRVVFTGKLSRNDIPAYLCNANILALARPKSIVADAGFPSKVTEYLATGKPVVTTKVGEIPVYLKDNENAFLSEPDSVEGFAEKLDYVLTNCELALNVGKNGKVLTTTVFNYSYQAKRILYFISTL